MAFLYPAESEIVVRVVDEVALEAVEREEPAWHAGVGRRKSRSGGCVAKSTAAGEEREKEVEEDREAEEVGEQAS